MNRHYKLFAAVAAGAAAATGDLCASEHDSPNIVVFIADDVSQSDFGCYGNRVIRTPNIDALASDGVRFTNAVLTASSSSPSRCSIMTGRYPHNTGACELHSPLGEEQVSLARVLKDAGYYTIQAGKWHFGANVRREGAAFFDDFDLSGGDIKDGGGDSGADRWVEFLRRRPADQPFFAWFAAHDAHRNWDDDTSMERYDPDLINVPDYMVDDMRTRNDIASYYYEVSRFDRSVGRAIDELKRQGLYDNTIIIVMADNGRPFVNAKTRLIKEGIWTPLIIRYPGNEMNRGRVCSSLVSSIDIAPTLAGAAGVQKVPSFQGRDFTEVIRNPEKKFRRYAFAEHNWHDFEAYERMVCTERYVYIENRRPQLSVIGAQDVMNGGSGVSLREGYEKDSLTDIQKDIFITPRPENLLYDNVSGTCLEVDTDGMKGTMSVKLSRVLSKWQRQTRDTCPTSLTQDWYDRKTMKRTSLHQKRGEMPGYSKGAAFVKSSGPF